MRHGKKPAEGLGQLDCQGLNRALALPQVLIAQFGTPAFIFAPDPREQVSDHGHNYNYVRPLATIEPTAIRLARPVITTFGFNQIDGLQKELERPQYRNSLVFVAWEHAMLVKPARNLVAKVGGDPSVVPKWNDDDFDSIYVLHLDRDGAKVSVSFSHAQEGLNNQSTTCPSGRP